MTKEDEIEISTGQKMIGLFIIALVLGIGIGWFVKDSTCISPERAPDYMVQRFETALMTITKVRPGLIHEGSSIGLLQDLYFRYGMVARHILKSELDEICVGNWNPNPKEVTPEYINESIRHACAELCNSDYVSNDTGKDIGLLVP